MKFINYPMLWVASSLTAGIISSYYFNWNHSRIALFGGLIIVGFTLLLIWVLERGRLRQRIFFGLLTWVCFFCVGFTNYELRKPESKPLHFMHSQGFETPQLLQIKIKAILKPNAFSQRYQAEVIGLGSKSVTGKILLSLATDTTQNTFAINEQLLVHGHLTAITGPRNPNQFSYKKYLKNQGIYFQLKTSSPYILKKSSGPLSFRSLAEELRDHILRKLKQTEIRPKQLAILQAIVLGYKKDLDAVQYEQFAAAGALHILAVSGLHVGILFLILSRLLSPLQNFRFGKQFKSVLIIFALWGFAIIAGLSPSVVRAVTMFSFFALAGMLDRPTNSYNTLLLSYFLLLLLAPEWLFHIGFQLSYLAVFFILWVQPKLYKLYVPKYRLDRLLWSITTVTIAAQLGVAPLSLFYFHQFPGLFLVTNLVILPFLSILLLGGLVVVILSMIELLPNTVAQAYDWVLALLDQFIAWVAMKETFLFDEVPFSLLMLLSVYGIIAAFLFYSRQPMPKQFVATLTAATLFYVVLTAENKWAHQEQLIVFHSFGKTTIGYQQGRSLTWFHSDSIIRTNESPLKSFALARRIQAIHFEKLPRICSFNNDILIIVDSSGLYPKSPHPIVLLTAGAKVHLERLIDELQPKLIIADGSNYPSQIDLWRRTCNQKQIPFHDTSLNGALMLERKRKAYKNPS